jgi:hypothetical protein
MDEENYTNVLLEDINGKFDLLIELVTPLLVLPPIVSKIADRLERVESDVKIIKKVVTGHSATLKNHENRITKLESA